MVELCVPTTAGHSWVPLEADLTNPQVDLLEAWLVVTVGVTV